MYFISLVTVDFLALNTVYYLPLLILCVSISHFGEISVSIRHFAVISMSITGEIVPDTVEINTQINTGPQTHTSRPLRGDVTECPTDNDPRHFSSFLLSNFGELVWIVYSDSLWRLVWSSAASSLVITRHLREQRTAADWIFCIYFLKIIFLHHCSIWTPGHRDHVFIPKCMACTAD